MHNPPTRARTLVPQRLARQPCEVCTTALSRPAPWTTASRLRLFLSRRDVPFCVQEQDRKKAAHPEILEMTERQPTVDRPRAVARGEAMRRPSTWNRPLNTQYDICCRLLSGRARTRAPDSWPERRARGSWRSLRAARAAPHREAFVLRGSGAADESDRKSVTRSRPRSCQAAASTRTRVRPTCVPRAVNVSCKRALHKDVMAWYEHVPVSRSSASNFSFLTLNRYMVSEKDVPDQAGLWGRN